MARTVICCIYKVVSIKTGNLYIGGTVNYGNRRRMHIHHLRKNKHSSVVMQSEFNMYGENNFLFDIIEICDKGNLINREQFYIDTLNPSMNLCKIAGSPKGFKHSNEFRIKRRLLALGNTNKRGKSLSEKQILGMSGENHYNCKLSHVQVNEIREKYIPRKYSSYKLAKEYGVCRQQINRIVNLLDRKIS